MMICTKIRSHRTTIVVSWGKLTAQPNFTHFLSPPMSMKT